MLESLPLIPVAVGQLVLPQTLRRTPEPEVMNSKQSLDEYDLAMQSKLAIVYAGALAKIHRMRRITGGKAVDLCCGPGHFTLLLAKYFDFDEVVGIDLSPGMIARAKANAQKEGLSGRVRFIQADATNVPLDSNEFNVVTNNDAAHHMPNLDLVRRLLDEMNRLASPLGLTLLTDLVRLKSEQLTKWYTNIIGKDYIARGLLDFQNDFCNSMRAAWTAEELAEAIRGQRDNRRWLHSVQKLVPTVQMIASHPDDDQPDEMRKDEPWLGHEHPVPKSLRREWELFNRFVAGSWKSISESS